MPDGKIRISLRGDDGTSIISGTKNLGSLPDGKDLCDQSGQVQNFEEDIIEAQEVNDYPASCYMPVSKLRWYETGWMNKLSRSGYCGGDDDLNGPCIKEYIEFAHPSFAWPTTDGVRFDGLPEDGEVMMGLNYDLNDKIMAKIDSGEVYNVVGNDSVRFLGGIFNFILSPV